MSKDVKQVLKDKGFYVALAVCLVAVGVVAVISLSRMLPPAEEGETTPTTTAPTVSTTVQGVQNPVTNIPDLRTTTAAPTTAPTTPPTDAPKPQDLYVLPLTNEVSKIFSPNEPLYSETMKDWRTHSGVDFTGEKGQTVKAAAAGKITVIKTDVMWGGMIEIDHGFGIVTRYSGVSARDIAVGDVVEVGEPIGVLATVPCEAEEGEHLHFEVLSSGKPLDAVAVIGVDVRYKE